MDIEIVYRIDWLLKENLSGTVCDYCGEEIDEFPCAVLTHHGKDPHALCKKCRLNSNISIEDKEYFETMAYQEKKEEPKPGINFGGRKLNGSNSSYQ